MFHYYTNKIIEDLTKDSDRSERNKFYDAILGLQLRCFTMHGWFILYENRNKL